MKKSELTLHFHSYIVILERTTDLSRIYSLTVLAIHIIHDAFRGLLIISCFGVCFRFTRHPHLYLTLHQRLVLVMSPQHPLVWCPPPLRPKATTICRLPQRSTVPTTTAVYRPISVNGMFKTAPSQEESFQKTWRSIYKTNAPILCACPAGLTFPHRQKNRAQKL